MTTALRRWRLGALLLAAVALIAAVMAAGSMRQRPAASAEVHQNHIVPPEGFTFAPVVEGGPPALSPVGNRIAFVAHGPAGRSLWVQTLDKDDARPLPGTEGAAAPFWSPSGDEVAFVADQKLKKVSIGGGVPQELAEAGGFSSQGAMPGTWNRDGTILFSVINSLRRVSSNGGEAVAATERDVAAFDENHYGPQFLSDNRHYVMLVRRGTELRLELVLGELGSNKRSVLLRNVTSAQYAPGRDGRRAHLLFVRDGKLMARPFDDRQLRLTGSEFIVAGDVAVTGGGGLGDFSVSPHGVLAYRRGASSRSRSDMVWYDRAGKQVGTVGDRPGHPRNNISIAPDGASAAFTRDDPSGLNVWIADLKTNGVRPFTVDGGRSPVWSPDGSEIAYVRQNAIYRRKVDGGTEDHVWTHSGIMAINAWSGDGRHLLLTVWDTNRKTQREGLGHWLLSDLSVTSPAPDAAPLNTRGAHGEFAPPSGTPLWIMSSGVNIRSMPGLPLRMNLAGSGNNSRHPRWRQHGEEVFLAEGESLAVLRATWNPVLKFFGEPTLLFPLPPAFKIAFGQWAPGWDVMPDGQRFLVTNTSLDIPASSIVIVTNWDRQSTVSSSQ